MNVFWHGNESQFSEATIEGSNRSMVIEAWPAGNLQLLNPTLSRTWLNPRQEPAGESEVERTLTLRANRRGITAIACAPSGFGFAGLDPRSKLTPPARRSRAE